MKIGLRKRNFHGAKEFFLKNFDFKNMCVSELNSKVVWSRNGHADSVGLELWLTYATRPPSAVIIP